MMATRRVGSAIVIDPDSQGIGIMTERDVLYAVGTGLDPDTETVGTHITWEVVYAGPSGRWRRPRWPCRAAASGTSWCWRTRKCSG